MDSYNNKINPSELIVGNTYKIKTEKTTILANFTGRNKIDGLHFVIVSNDNSNGHTIVLEQKLVFSIFSSN